MNKKSKKAYDKAMYYYEKGQIDKALNICEMALSESLKSSAILNLKGLLLYQKGELNAAITVWKINKDYNNDLIAKNYIKDSAADKKRLEMYILGELELKNLNIDNAIKIFKKCAESDFNGIKVNTALALCYQKKGDFKLAQEYINKALSLDANAVTAKSIKKNLLSTGVYEKEKKSYKNAIVMITILIVIFLTFMGTYMGAKIWNNKKSNNKNEQANKIENLEDSNKTDANNIISDDKNEPVDIGKIDIYTNRHLNKDKLIILLQNKDLDEIYEEIKDFKLDSLNSEEEGIYRQAIDILKSEGVQTFYNRGLTYFNEKSYENATVEFDKAYIYCEGSYLKEHIMYYKANTSLKKGKNIVALEEYEQYYNQYPKGVYTESVLYQLSLLADDVDKEKSKDYASKLLNNYPNSIYINDYIIKIINS